MAKVNKIANTIIVEEETTPVIAVVEPVEASADCSPASEDPEVLAARIAEAAYRKAESRGFEPGHELDDWLEAEKEIMAPEISGADPVEP